MCMCWQELEDPLVLIHEKKISNINAVIKILELALKVRISPIKFASFCFDRIG